MIPDDLERSLNNRFLCGSPCWWRVHTRLVVLCITSSDSVHYV